MTERETLIAPRNGPMCPRNGLLVQGLTKDEAVAEGAVNAALVFKTTLSAHAGSTRDMASRWANVN